MTAQMTPDHRLVLFNFIYDTDHLVWLYRSAIDRTHNAHLTSEHMCLVDFASRGAALARSLLDEDNRRRDTRKGFKPTPSALRDRLRSVLAARRQALQKHDAPAAAPTPTPDPPPDDPPLDLDQPAFDSTSADPDIGAPSTEEPAEHDGTPKRPRMRPR